MDIKSLLILISFCVLILYVNPLVEGNTAPFGFCANLECSDPVSKGVTILRYHSPDDNKISVEVNEEVIIYVKEYGPKKDLWGVIVRGNKGYISKNFVRETQLFVKRLVPANIEFRTNLISDSITVSSHVHVSSQHLHSGSFINDAAPSSFIHTQTVQHDFISAPPNSFLQSQSSFSENYDSYISSNLNPSGSIQYDQRFAPSPHFNEVPVQSSPNLNPSGNMQYDQRLVQSPHFNDVPVQSSHFHSEPISSPPHTFGMQSGNILPSPTPVPDMRHSSSYHAVSGGSLHVSQSFDSSLNNIPNFEQRNMLNIPQGEQFDPNSVFPSQTFQGNHFNQHSSIQQQHFQSPQIPEMHSSFPSEDFDDELSRTLAMLSDRGFHNTDMYANSLSGSHGHLSPENSDINFDFRKAELSGIHNQPQYQSSHNLDTTSSQHGDSSLYPSANLNQPMEEVINSHVPEEFNVNKIEILEKVKDGENTEANDKLDILAEAEEEVADDDEEEEDDESLDSSEGDELTLNSNEITNTETQLNLQSSMTSLQNEQQTSKTNQDVQSSTENSFMDSSRVQSSGIEETSKSVSEKEFEVVSESLLPKNVFDVPERNNDGFLPTSMFDKEHSTKKVNDFFVESEQNSELNRISGIPDINGISDDLTTFQNRNLKGEFGTTEEQQSDSDNSNEENNTQSDSEMHGSFENWFNALKVFVDSIISWIPDPLYSALMDLRNKGISPRVPVFTALCGFTCIFLIIPIIFIKEWSKESRLTAQLASVEKDAYTLSATKSVLEEKLETFQSELASLQASLAEEKNATKDLKASFENQEELENAKSEIESCLQVIDSLKEKENEYLSTIREQEKEIEQFAEHKEALDKMMKDQENSISDLTDQLLESENKLQELEKEKLQFLQLKEDYEEKLAQFDKSCNQLLQEAEVWNLRVQQLTTDLDEERKMKQELIETVNAKEEEIESLKQLVEAFNVIDEIEDPEEQAKAKEEKLQSLLDASMIVNQLKQEEEKSKLLDEQLTKEKNKVLDMEVELLESKSEIDKLKLSYNQALQDKAEAQTKLDVLTNYFKDKEIQLQKQLGAQEAVRQKKEEDANSAERRICLIEQENASYKYQVASMKQEMEETERNLKSQIATQEKKAHENWIAARAAERKLEDMKTEVTQLRQRLTLLEREQEHWANASRNEVLRPVPNRMPGGNDESGNHDLNTSERGIFPHPAHHDRLPPPMMLPPDRPLPPLPPPPIPPMFLPHMERHFRPQPWHIPPPEHSSEYRTTPPEFMTGRESTPPRGRQITDGDTGPHASSPLTTDTRDSRNSTPPHLLPDFHDVPPQPGRSFFPPPPPLGHPRLPMHHPPYRRDAGPGPKRSDHPNEFNTRGSQQAPPQEQWQHSRV